MLVIYTLDMHIYTTHHLKWEWIREEKKREWLFLVIYTFGHAHLHNSPAKNGNESEKRKRSGYSSHLYV